MARPATVTVTEIATSYGFGELGSFFRRVSVAVRGVALGSAEPAARQPPTPKNTASPVQLPESA
jgi:hypothetical protein